MPLRFCKSCAEEVEDAGGYCLLGHPLKLEAPIPSVAEMRAEVGRALGEARIESRLLNQRGAELFADEVVVDDAAEDGEPPPPPRAPQSVWQTLESEEPQATDPITAFAPPARMDWGPEERSGLRGRNPLRRKGRPAPA